MSSIVLYFLLFITRPCYHEPRNAAVARPTEAELKLMLRSAFFVLTLAAFASTAGVADDKKPSGKPDAAQTTRPQDKGLDKMMPFTGPAVDPKSYIDRKSTRLNSSHTVISYAVFCLKKKKRPP